MQSGKIKSLLEQYTQAQELLKYSEEKFNQLVNNIDAVFYITTANLDNIIYISPGYEKIWGKKGSSLIENPLDWFESIHKEDQLQVAQALKKLDDQDCQNVEVEYRIIRPDGSIRWIYDKKYIILDEFGKPYRNAGIATDITVQKNIEEALKVSEEKYRNIVETSLEGIWMRNNDNKIVFLNKRLAEMLGFTVEELMGSSIFDLMNEETKRLVLERLKDRAKGVSEVYEIKLYRKDGKAIFTRISASPIFDKEKISGSVSLVTDITKERQAFSHLKIQYSLSKLLFEAFNLEAVATKILEIICIENEWDLGNLWTINEMSSSLSLIGSWNAPGVEATAFYKASRELKFERGVDIPGKTWEKKKPVFVKNIDKIIDFKRKEAALEAKLNCGLSIPIIISNECIGLIELFSSKPRDMEEQLLIVMEAIGIEMGAFIKRASIENRLIMTYKSLMESQRIAHLGNFEITFESLSSLGPKKLDWSDEVYRIFGYEPGEIEPDFNFFINLIHPADREKIKEGLMDCINSEVSCDIFFRIITHTGQEKNICIKVQMKYDPQSKQQKKLFGIIQDVTELIKLKDEKSRIQLDLTESEDLYRNLVDASPDVIILQKGEVITFINKSGLEMYGAESSKEIVGKSVWKLIHPEYEMKARVMMAKIHKKIERVSVMEGKIITLKGEIKDVEIALKSFVNMGEESIYVILHDLTIRRKAQKNNKLLFNISQVFAAEYSFEVASVKMLKIICKNFNFDVGNIWILNKNANKLCNLFSWASKNINAEDFLKETKKIYFDMGEGLPGIAWELKVPLWRKKITCSRKDYFDILKLKLFFAVPIVHENTFLGVLEFFGQHELGPDESVINVCQGVASQYGLFMKRRDMENQINYREQHDLITNLPNRNLLDCLLTKLLHEDKSKNQKFAIVTIRIDNISTINTSSGMKVGDYILKTIAKNLKKIVQEKGIVGKLIGSEFCVVLEIEDNEQIKKLIDKLQILFAIPIEKDGKLFFLKAYIGISLYPEDGHDSIDLFNTSNIAMLLAKKGGPNTFQVFKPEMAKIASERLSLESELRLALKEEEFAVYYQPKYNMLTKKIIGAEALIRWNHPNGLRYPKYFIDVAEEADIIIPINEWVLNTVIKNIKEMHWDKYPDLSVSINLSAKQFIQDDFLDKTKKVLLESKLNSNCLEFEITETMMIGNVDSALSILQSIKKMGVNISVDDFGTGYSSLNFLKHYNVDYIKIDQSFIQNVTINQNDASIVQAIIAMSAALGSKVIAEGVETEDQAKFLLDNNCERIQGFYFSKALLLEDFNKLLRENLGAIR